MKKRIVSFLMALVMAVSLLPVSAFAVGNEAVISVSANNQSLEVTQIGTTHFGDDEYDGGLYLVKVPSGTERFQVTNSGKNNYLIEMDFCLGDGTNNEYTLDNATNEGFTDFIAELVSDGVITVTDESAFADSTIRAGTIAYSNEADGAPVDILVVQEKTAGTGGDVTKSDPAIKLTTDGLGSDYKECYTGKLTIGSGDSAIEINKTYILSFQKDDFTITNTTGKIISTKFSLYDYKGALTSSSKNITGTGTRTNTEIADFNPNFSFIGSKNLVGIGYPEAKIDKAATKYYFLYFDYAGTSSNHIDMKYALLVEITPNGTVSIDKSALQALITEAEAFGTSNYYTENDRYNGKNFDKQGFWKTFQDTLTAAKNTLKISVTQEEIDAAVANLTAAIANLIPADRANTTALYEALQKTEAEQDAYTAKSWAAYQTARDKAEALMAEMFDDEGRPVDGKNTKNRNTEIETAAKALNDAYAALDEKATDGNKTIASLNLEAIRYLAKKYNPDTLTGYTDESIRALRDARTAAQTLADKIDLTEMGQSESQPLGTALRELRKAVYGLTTTSAAQIKVNVSVLDANDIYAGYTGEFAHLHNPNTYTAAMTLEANASAYDLLNGKSLLTNRNSAAEAVVFLNGELVYGSLGATGRYHDIGNTGGSSTFQAIKLHNGDALTLVWIYPKQVEYSSQAGTYPAYLMDIPDYFRCSTLSAPVEVEAGKPFSISVTSEAALPFHTAAGTRAVTGAKVYRSDAGETADAAATGYVGVDTFAVTDGNGQAQVTLYNEGYVLLNAFRTDDDQARYTVGASVLVHVKPASDLAAVKKQLRAELDAVYGDEQHPETVFTAENWQKVQDAYNTAIAAIDAAETSGAAGDAQLAAIRTIKQLQSSADNANTSNLKRFHTLLNALPDDVSKLDVNVEQQIKDLKTCYEAMTVYQRSQLTAKEQKKYDAVIKALADGLSTAKQYELTFQQQYSNVPAADQAVLEQMIAYLQGHTPTDDKYTEITGGNQLAKLFSFNTARGARNGTAYDELTEAAALTQNIYACVNPDYTAYLLCRDAALAKGQKNGPGVISGTNWSISDESMTMFVPDVDKTNYTRVLGHMTYTVNSKQYAIRSVTVSGLESDTTKQSATFYDTSVYRGRGVNQCNQVVPDTFLRLTTGFNDVTVTVTWAPVDTGSVDLTAERDKALSALKAELNKYTIFDKNYSLIKRAYDSGVKAINAADTLEGINNARAKAISNMNMAAGGGYIGAEIKGWSLGDPFDAGEQVGTVTVSVANFTYDDGYYYRPAGETPFLYKENYPLGANDTMMTVILRALAEEGYSWTGTGGDTYGITYLSSISTKENGKTHKLGEFDGGQQSGWMGTLNDWFNNLSFAEFTVAKGTLADGDVISIQYTSTGLGEDLGGTWGNSDTTLKALDIEGGKLLTAFASGEAGNTYEYTLAIDSASTLVKLTPTAANKNYLTKIFLNEKVTDNTEGSSFFKRTQSIPVANGDTIYIGCGEYAWPSMNNQETEARDYQGTWYVLHVVNVNEGSGYVNDAIDALPSASDVSYGSYQETAEAAAAARAAYDALSDTAKKNVDPDKLAELEALEKAVAEFQAIDDVKDQIDALPSEGKLTIADRDAVKAAQAAYGALSAEQKEYLTFAQIAKIEALSKRMAEIEKEAVKAVEDLIDDIGTVTKDSKDKIDAARRAYDGLTKEQQEQVSNYQTLVDAEKAYAKLTGGTTPSNPDKKPGGSTTPDKKPVKSGNTGDAGITLYVGMGLVAVIACGALVIGKKRKEN